MTVTYDRPLGLQTLPGSPRVRLAQLAHAAALRVPGVVATESGPMRLVVTSGEGQRVDGVRCVAAGNGSYDVSLRLCCELVPLLVVGDAVRVVVARTAITAGIVVARIDVLIGDVLEPGWTR